MAHPQLMLVHAPTCMHACCLSCCAPGAAIPRPRVLYLLANTRCILPPLRRCLPPPPFLYRRRSVEGGGGSPGFHYLASTPTQRVGCVIPRILSKANLNPLP